MNNKQRLRSRADKLWYIKYLQLGCEVCGNDATQVHHFYYKGSYGHLRYEKDNAISICMPCHFVLHHQDPKKIEERIIENKGKVWYNRIKKLSRIKPPPSYLTIKYYNDIIKQLE